VGRTLLNALPEWALVVIFAAVPVLLAVGGLLLLRRFLPNGETRARARSSWLPPRS
jgi:hypothetical protein